MVRFLYSGGKRYYKVDWSSKFPSDFAAAKVADRLKTSQYCLQKWGGLLQRYHGGMPVGFLASIMASESGGDATNHTITPGLDEYGLFQVEPHIGPAYGYPSDARMRSPDWNVFLACLDYNVRAKLLKLNYPGLVIDGTDDQWKLTHLRWAVGSGGFQSLLAKITPQAGNTFNVLMQAAWDNANTSDATMKNRWRITAIVGARLWDQGQQIYRSSSDYPVVPPSPDGSVPQLPKSVAGLMKAGMGVGTVVLVAALGYLLWKRWRG